MGYTFASATSFNADISKWQLGEGLQSLYRMFKDASSFNRDLSSWKVDGTSSGFPAFEETFYGTSSFTFK